MSATVANAYFAYNAVTVAGNSGGLDTGGNLVATDTVFLNNRTSGGSAGGSGAGGNATLDNVQYIGNSSNGYGGGALAFGRTNVTGSLFLSNTSSDLGGGLSTGYAVINNSRLENNHNLGTNGGGIYAQNGARLTDTLVLSNTAAHYGGGMETGSIFLTRGTFQGNSSGLNGGGLSDYGALDASGTRFIGNIAGGGPGGDGGGAMAVSLAVTVKNGYFSTNTALSARGGAIWANDALNLSDTILDGNTATTGDGGAAFVRGPVMIERARFANNQSGAHGGALFVTNTLMLSSSLFVNNYALSGGGLYLGAGGGRIVNSLFARNVATSQGMAMYLAPTSTVQLWFSTVAAPTMAIGDAIRITAGNVDIQDTVVASHTYGIYRQGGAVFQDYNLLFGNTNDSFGVISGGAHNANGDPRFLNPAADDYHLGLVSAALDKGTDLGVYTDIDGQVRPQGPGFDIGYDEAAFFQAYVPIVVH